MYLSEWNYTKDEWKSYLRWEKRQYGVILYWFKNLRAIKQRNIPEIKIANDRVWINSEKKLFKGQNKQFREIKILDAGNINILEISYTQEYTIKKINVPIPKGKLREAFVVQEGLHKC